MTADIFAAGAPAFEEESDLELAEQAIGGNLKVLEGLLKSDPHNRTLLTLLAKSYGGYSFAFIEDQYEALKYKDEEKASHYKKRASQFYMRGRDYAFRILFDENSDFKEALTSNFETFKSVLQDFNGGDVEALFWGAYNWGNWVNMNLHEPEAIADAPRMELMMARVLELNPAFYYGGPELFYGVYYGGRPAMLGGNVKKAKNHFEKSLKLTERKFLISQVLYAQYFAVQTQDKMLYRKLLEEVVSAKDDILPEQNLITQLAKKKAHRLLENQRRLF